MEVVEVIAATPNICRSISKLLPQLLLNGTIDEPDVNERVKSLIECDATTLFAVFQPSDIRAQGDSKSDDDLLGVAVLVLFPTIGYGPSGSGFLKARIEDVVVDEKHRGKGVGQALMEACVAKAAGAGVDAIDLTSNPRREAAHRLYERNGFEYYDTKVYRKKLK